MPPQIKFQTVLSIVLSHFRLKFIYFRTVGPPAVTHHCPDEPYVGDPIQVYPL